MSNGDTQMTQQRAPVREDTHREDRQDLFRERLRVLSPAPDFTLQDLAGNKVSLSDYKGKKHVVLEFGAIT